MPSVRQRVEAAKELAARKIEEFRKLDEGKAYRNYDYDILRLARALDVLREWDPESNNYCALFEALSHVEWYDPSVPYPQKRPSQDLSNPLLQDGMVRKAPTEWRSGFGANSKKRK